MNHRLDELFVRAGGQFGHYGEPILPDIEKFAELIVRECAEVDDNADATREKWEGIGKYVREHFGVE